MATLILGAVGAGIGSAFGNPALGFSLGVTLAGVLFPPKVGAQSRGKLDDLRVTGSAYGTFIPQIYGRGRVGGNVVWATPLEEHVTKKKVGGKGTGGAGKQKVYTYSVNMSLLVCQGPVNSIRRIWGEDKLIFDAVNVPGVALPSNIHIYYGTEDQPVSSVMEAVLGAGNVPAYRGYCYLVFEDFDLTPWGGRVPAISIEVDQGSTYDGFATSQSSLLAYYRFEDTPGLLNDSGPNGWNFSGPGSAQVSSGAVGEALNFTTAGNTLSSAIGDQIRLQGTELTIEFWAKYKGSGTGALLGGYSDNTFSNYSFTWGISTFFGGTIDMDIAVTSGFTTTGGSFPLDSSWHQVTLTYKAGDRYKCYVDGALVADAPAMSGSLAFTGTGKQLFIDDGPFYLDEYAIYDRVLTAGEVGQRYGRTSGTTVQNILENLFGQVGLTPSQYELSAASDLVDGFVIASRTSVREAIDPLLRIYQVDLVEVDGKIKAVKRGGAAVATLTDDDLGAHDFTDASPENRVEVKRVPDIELPWGMDLAYFSPTKDYEQAVQSSWRETKFHVNEPVTINTPLVLDDTFARQQVVRIHYTTWLEREQFAFALMPQWQWLCPGDVVNLPTAGGLARVRIIGMDTALFGAIPCQGVLDDAGVLTQTATGGTLTDTDTERGTSLDTVMRIVSMNALRDVDADSIGVYVAVAGSVDGADWDGAILMMSRDSGATYQSIAELTDAATIGTCQTVLAAPPPYAGTGMFDRTNTLDVLITNETAHPPVSASEAEVLNGANVALVGNEVIQYVTVTPLGSNQYRLSNLLRGRRGTNYFAVSHGSSERFVPLDNGGATVRVELTADLFGKTVQFKAVTVGQEIASVSPVALAITGDEFKCYSGCDLRGSRASSDLTVTWKGRTRKQGAWIDGFDATEADAPAVYEGVIMNGFVEMRTFPALSSPTFTYTSAQQTTDFGSPQSSISVVVYQIGKYGRGYPLTGTL